MEQPAVNETTCCQLLKVSRDRYREHFESEATICACAPGRVNLIGEHTDYNDGFVLPMALPLVTMVLGQPTNTKQCRILTTCDYVEEPKEIVIDVSSIDNLVAGSPSWGNYVKGVMRYFKGSIPGFNALITSSVPVGGGLSSSAALEVAMYTFLDAITNQKYDESLGVKALICQRAEHEFSGMPCGIMDQFISFMGEENHALLLDCRSLNFTLVPLRDLTISFLITNTNVRHELTGSEYHTRREQCEEAAAILGKSSLRDVNVKDLEANKVKLSDVVYRRARHVVTEIYRTLDAATALEKEDYNKFGVLMQQSHKSLKDDFEVSCKELDQVVDATLECDGVYGSRMTGGGFGGCTVTLLKTDAVQNVIRNIMEKYEGNATFYVCRPAKGAQLLTL